MCNTGLSWSFGENGAQGQEGRFLRRKASSPVTPPEFQNSKKTNIFLHSPAQALSSDMQIVFSIEQCIDQTESV